MARKIELIKTGNGYRLAIDQLTFDLVDIPGGKFRRGDGKEVAISPFCLSEFTVTQELYHAVTGENPSRFEGNNRPVEQVSWYNAIRFCGALNQAVSGNLGPGSTRPLLFHEMDDSSLDQFNLNPSHPGFRLPTEAEWEYAACGGVTGNMYAGSNILDTVGWYGANSGGETKPVGLKFPNGYGLYDMSGNVWEWCWDRYDPEYDQRVVNDPSGPKKGRNRLIRGGSWYYLARSCRPGNRSSGPPGSADNDLGFRLSFPSRFERG
jgi:formylglycine-generating enzyme required for sulfatase activity